MVVDVKVKANTIKVDKYLKSLEKKFPKAIEQSLNRVSAFGVKQITENNKAIIYIVDQGRGINEKLKDKIFERFYTDRDDKKNYHTGLGLSISRKIMEIEKLPKKG